MDACMVVYAIQSRVGDGNVHAVGCHIGVGGNELPRVDVTHAPVSCV
jgi:hypothetical protein